MQYILNEKEYLEFLILKKKNIPVKKRKTGHLLRCPTCNYVVDNCVPKQHYCDRCGQRLR